jgi:hypothetical protein
VGQDAGIHHQQFLVGPRFATEHDPAEARLRIDLQQQIRQLRLADPVIERGAQLDQFRLLLLGRQRRQVQLVIDLEVTGLDGLGDGGNARLGAFDEGSRYDSARFGNDRRR